MIDIQADLADVRAMLEERENEWLGFEFGAQLVKIFARGGEGTPLK